MERNIEINIEELVFYGFEPTVRHQIADAMKSELIRLLSEKGIHSKINQEKTITRIDAGAFSSLPNEHAKSTGIQIAKSVYQGLTL